MCESALGLQARQLALDLRLFTLGFDLRARGCTTRFFAGGFQLPFGGRSLEWAGRFLLDHGVNAFARGPTAELPASALDEVTEQAHAGTDEWGM